MSFPSRPFESAFDDFRPNPFPSPEPPVPQPSTLSLSPPPPTVVLGPNNNWSLSPPEEDKSSAASAAAAAVAAAAAAAASGGMGIEMEQVRMIRSRRVPFLRNSFRRVESVEVRNPRVVPTICDKGGTFTSTIQCEYMPVPSWKARNVM